MPEPLNNGEQKDELYNIYNSPQPGDETPEPDEGLPEEEPEDELVVLEDETKPLTEEQIEKLLQAPDEVLKKYGIDDTKQWKSYQRALTKMKQEQKKWEQEKAEYESKLQSSDSRFDEIQKEIQTIKNPEPKQEPLKAPIPPQMPTKPVDFDWADVSIPGTTSYNYMTSKTQFDMESYNYQVELANYNNKLLMNVTQELKSEKSARARQLELEGIKADALSKFMQSGLSAAEAQECWKEATANAKSFYSPENVAELYKITKGIKQTNPRKKKFDKLKNKRKFGIPPGIGGGESEVVSNPNEFSKSIDTSSLYETK